MGLVEVSIVGYTEGTQCNYEIKRGGVLLFLSNFLFGKTRPDQSKNQMVREAELERSETNHATSKDVLDSETDVGNGYEAESDINNTSNTSEANYSIVKARPEKEHPHILDAVSRFIFPLAFMLFNAIYWSYFLR